MKVVVRIARQSGGIFRAWCPALPGCHVLGRSKREAKARIQKAVRGYVDGMDVALPREVAKMFKNESTRGIA